MKRAWPLAVAGMLTLAACGPKHPENPALDAFPPGILGSTNISYYEIHGRTAAELVAEMRRLGPKSSAGAFFGETMSPIRWQYRTRNLSVSCEIENLAVTVTTEMTLPRWTPPPDTVPGLYSQWTTFMAALEAHEIGHKDISGRAAVAVQRALTRFSGPCATMANDIRHLTDPILQRLQLEQMAYDAETRHGATQGALFPPRRIQATTPPEY